MQLQLELVLLHEEIAPFVVIKIPVKFVLLHCFIMFMRAGIDYINSRTEQQCI